ncbi:MAG TPA: sodium/solute symporter [Tepidisphaeraceae bacterium]|nr:sodium/solute symporter [Tepidisphaeraceae bacterium]
MPRIHLSALDLTIFALYMVAAVALGFFVARGKRKTSQGYFLGDRKLPWFVVATSMVAADISSEHFIANAGAAYKYGLVPATASWNSWIIYSLLIWIFLPYYVRTRLYTLPQFLERRYHPSCRYIFSAALLVGYVGAIIAGALYAGGITLHNMLGFLIESRWHITPDTETFIGIFFFGIITGAYTIYGGLTSAAWTDFMQIIVLGFAGVMVPIIGLHRVGGIVHLAHEIPYKFQLFLPVTHPVFPFTGILSGFLTVGIWYSCTSQHMVQRVLAAKDEYNARMGVVGAGYLHIFTPFFFVLPGLIAIILLPHLKNPDVSYLSLVELLVPSGIRGLIFAGMAAALMSNLAAVLNSASTLLTIDFYKSLFKPEATEHEQVRFGQISGTFILVLGMGIACIFTILHKPLFVLVQNIFFYIAPPFAVVFTMGILWKRANFKAAMTTIITGFIFTAILDHTIHDLAYLHRAFFAWCFCMIVMGTVSLLTAPPPPEKVEGIVWSRRYANLPEEERKRYRGLKDFRIWWLLFVIIILCIYGFFVWFRLQYPVPMLG